jgi:hypothetical protein
MTHQEEPRAPDVRADILKLLVDRKSTIPDPKVAVNEFDPALNILREITSAKVIFADVPLTSIVAVNHDNPADSEHRVLEERSWLAIMDGIEAKGWGKDQTDYMESEIGERDFNAPGATGILEFWSVGGAVGCQNGLHRLTAAVCWLSGLGNKDHGVLRKAPVITRPLPGHVQNLLVESSANRRDVFVANPLPDGSTKSGVLMRIVDPKLGEQQWKVSRAGIEKLAQPRPKNPFERWRDAGQIEREPTKPDWIEIPRLLLEALADHRWLTNQLDRPRYPDQPQKLKAAPDAETSSPAANSVTQESRAARETDTPGP